MNPILERNSFLIINNFMPTNVAKDLHSYFLQDTIDNPQEFNHDVQCPKSLAVYDYHPFLEILVESIPFVSDMVGETVLPTYSYARQYKSGDILAPHIDRGACEISLTLHLGSDGVEWPIYFRKPDNSIAGVHMVPGQAVMYLGCVAEHWRDEYKGNEYGQVFLHYVRSRGPYGKHYFDKVKK